jgi:hypothetical protein
MTLSRAKWRVKNSKKAKMTVGNEEDQKDGKWAIKGMIG